MAKSRKSVLVILSILTVAASITKILIGLDFDENYITVLGLVPDYRIYHGTGIRDIERNNRRV